MNDSPRCIKWPEAKSKRLLSTPILLLIVLQTLPFYFKCSDYLTSPGPQPSYINGKIEHDPKFSVFGVLRPDSTEAGLPQSFIKLETSFPMNEYPDSNPVTDASVRLCRLENGVAADSFLFEYTDYGSYPDTLFRHAGFFPKGGETYRLECSKPGYSTLQAETTVPRPPVIVPGSMSLTPGRLRFQVMKAMDAYLYEVVLLGETYYQSERFLRPESGNVSVSINLDMSDGSPSLLLLYAFDKNLAEYLSANISIKPNIYQSDFSTVQNGYGCFGALNCSWYDL